MSWPVYLAGVAVWLSLGTLAFTDATGHRRIGLLPAPWLLALLIAAVVAFVAATRRSPQARRPFYLSILVLLPWLPFPVPGAFLLWTGPAAGLVWGAVALCAAGTVIHRWKAGSFSAFFDPRHAPRIAGVFAFVVLLGVRAHQVLPPAGDEPHYLLIAQSLLNDRDLRVANNYQQADYADYYAGPLAPHYARPALDGSLYSGHAPGLPAVIAPAFALGGYPAVIAWIAAIAALGTCFVWKAAYELTADAAAAWFAWAAAALTAPMVIEGTLVYPDAVAGTLLAGGVLAIITARSISVAAAVGTGIAIGLLPWLHTRLLIPATFLTAVLLVRLAGPGEWRARWRIAIGVLMPAALSAAAWLGFVYYLYGTFNPSAPYDDRIPLQPERIVAGLLGLFADQEFGLLPNAPVHLLWLGGLWSVLRQHRRVGAELVLITVPYVIAMGTFEVWWGGSTPARYLAPMVFPLAITIAPLWRRQDTFGRSMCGALLVVSLLIGAAFGFGDRGSLAYNSAEGRSAFLDWVAPLVDLPAALPSYFRASPPSGAARGSISHELLIPALIWLMALAAAWFSSRAFYKRYPAVVSPQVLAGVCLVVTITLAVTTTWARGDGGTLTTTRAQIDLVAREDPHVRPLALQLLPFRFMPSNEALRRLSMSTSTLEAAPAGALLFLREVPPGEYRLRFTVRAAPRGNLALSIGRATRPITVWRVSAPEQPYTFPLPIHASSITVSGDAEAAQSIQTMALVPVHHITTPWAATNRARDAARYGRSVVYAIDNRVVLEPDGFWVLAGRQPDVAISVPDAVSALTVEVRNVAIANRVSVAAGGWSETRDLAPDERWRVTVPLTDPTQLAIVNFRVEDGVRVGAEVVGCRVVVIE
jgi:hypothetical protein